MTRLNWLQIIDDADIGTGVRELATHCTPVSLTPTCIHLSLPHEHRRLVAFQDLLRSALERLFGHDVTLQIDHPDTDEHVKTRTGHMQIDRRQGWTITTHRMRG